MIVLDLCCDSNHMFEGWFVSAEDFEAQRTSGKVACPICASASIVRRPSAPYVQRGEKKFPVKDFGEAMRWLLAEVQKSMSLQRYKGLGEMNPSQLWETTMDPTRRRLLQVRIEDDVEADGIFTVLMGDQVEPRRLFIENNALNVRNLDV